MNAQAMAGDYRSPDPHPGYCGDDRGWVRSDFNTEGHCPCFNKSLGSCPARQQVVIGNVDEQLVPPDLIEATSIVEGGRQQQACDVRASTGREGEMAVDVA